MAAYSKSITAAGMKVLFEKMLNISDKEIFYSMCDLLNTEYAAMETAGLAGYTVTTGLQFSLEQLCERMSNSVQVEILKHFFEVLLTEFASVETNGLAYTITTDATVALNEFKDLLHQAIENYQNVENRIMLHSLIDQIQAEHVLLAAAS